MSRMQAGIILAGQQPDLINALARGQEARARSDAYQNQNAVRQLFQTQGADILAGNQNALNALAQYDPGQALAIQGQHQSQAQSAQTHQMRVEQYARGLTAEQRAAEAAALEQGIKRAIGAYQAGDLDGLNQILQSAGEQPIQDLEQFPAIAGIYGDALETLKSVTDLAAGPEPADEYQRYVQEESAAGRTPLGRIEYAQAKKGKGFSFEQGPDGVMRISFGGSETATGDNQIPTNQDKLGVKISEKDAAALKEAEEQAAASDSLNLNISEAESVMATGVDTGMGSGVKKFVSKLGAATGIGTGENAENYEDLDRISKGIGIDTLRAMGGNDTERELLTAIQTTVSPQKEESSNLRVIARQKAAADTIAEKPRLMAAWIERYGSLSNPNPGGEVWSTYWRGQQLEMFHGLSDQYMAELGVQRETQAEQPTTAPEVGATEDGYRFKGGDPGDPNNWQKVGN